MKFLKYLPVVLLMLACSSPSSSSVPSSGTRIPSEFPLYPHSVYTGGYFKGPRVDAIYETSDDLLRVSRFYRASLTYGPWRMDENTSSDAQLYFHSANLLDHRHGEVLIALGKDRVHVTYRITFIYP